MTDSPVDEAEPVTPAPVVRIMTGSRLHFGLLDTVAPFGGIGVMIDDPVTEVVVSASDRFRCNEDVESRVRPIAVRVAKMAKSSELPKCRVEVQRRAASHFGLGSGTQLAMAVSEGICQCAGLQLAPSELAIQVAERGQRSAVGVHGYFSGGLIFENASQICKLNPVEHRVELPVEWCVGLFRPTCDIKSVSGEFEREQFAQLLPVNATIAATLNGLIINQIVPAARKGDLPAFAEAVQEYNHASGMLFEAVQGGPYNGNAVANVVSLLKTLGAQGVGQSSWGPGVFSWFDSRISANDFTERLPSEIEVIAITHPRNQNRMLESVRSEN